METIEMFKDLFIDIKKNPKEWAMSFIGLMMMFAAMYIFCLLSYDF